MAEAELSADLLMALVGGVQSNKTVEQYYKMYEDNAGPLDKGKDHFNTIMSYVGTIYPPEELATTNWSRIHLFYTLFTAIAHGLYGIQGPNSGLRPKISDKKIGQIRVCLDEISATYDRIADDPDDPGAPKDYKNFIERSRRATTDTTSRVERTDFVCKKLQQHLAQPSL
jgi:hypothetical protein